MPRVVERVAQRRAQRSLWFLNCFFLAPFVCFFFLFCCLCFHHKLTSKMVAVMVVGTFNLFQCTPLTTAVAASSATAAASTLSSLSLLSSDHRSAFVRLVYVLINLVNLISYFLSLSFSLCLLSPALKWWPSGNDSVLLRWRSSF